MTFCLGATPAQQSDDVPAKVAPTSPDALANSEPPSEARQEYEQSARLAIKYLRAQQNLDGGYSSPADPGATALITTALLRQGVDQDDPLIAKSLAYLKTFVQEDGGVYREGTYYRNYETCLAIVCFSQADGAGEYSKIIQDATKFVKEIQWDSGEETDPSDPAYGGAGYGKHGRPDLSNTQYLLDALHESGDGDNYEAIQRAIRFVSRCQNLKSEHNDTKFADREGDGGFYYTPAAGGSSQAGNTENGGLRSYGSMTYAGLKSMIYAGLNAEDKRVKAAVQWIRKNYRLTENPGMGAAGLFYYYHTFAKALSALGEESFEDDDGVKHDWRAELRAALFKRQRPDGSWLNELDRWYEGDAKLVTGYALMTLSYCRPD